MTNSTINNIKERGKLRRTIDSLRGNPGDRAVAIVYLNDETASVKSALSKLDTCKLFATLAQGMITEIEKLKAEVATEQPTQLDPSHTDPRVEFASGEPEIDDGLHGYVDPEPRGAE